MIELETKRLVLKLPQNDNRQALVGNLNDYDVAKWLSNVPLPYTMSHATEWVRTVNAGIKDESPSFQPSIFMDEALIGGVGLRPVDKDVYELGFWLAKDYWGRGLAIEAATGLLRYGRRKLSGSRFIAHCAKENAASMSVLQKLGFRLVDEVDVYFRPRHRSTPCFRLTLE